MSVVALGSPQHLQIIEDLIRKRGEESSRMETALITIMVAPHKDIEDCRRIAREALGVREQ